MSRRDDHDSEMRTNRALDEREMESVLRGQMPPGRPDLEPLARFVEATWAETLGPPPAPNRALASLLESGLDSDPRAARLAAARAERTEAVPRPRRSRTLASAAARAAGLGLATKLAAVSAVTVTGLAGAGAAGVLPDPVQAAVADSMDTITPFTIPRPSDPHAPGRNGIGEQVRDRAGHDGTRSGRTGGTDNPAGKTARGDKHNKRGDAPSDPRGPDAASKGKGGKKDQPGHPPGGPSTGNRGKGHEKSPPPTAAPGQP